MAVLDTFYWLFKTNADEARRGMEGAEASAGSFERSVEHADEVVHQAGERIIEVFTNVAIRIASAFAIEQVLEFTTHIIETNAALQDTSERIGVAVEDLNALQNAAKRFGGSADGATASLDFLNRGMADIAVKGTSRLKPFFDELKINVLAAPGHVKPLLEVYAELADRFQTMTKQERAGYGERFGIDQGLLLTLAEGRRGFEDIIAREKELGVVTAEDAEQADKFSKKMDDLRVIFAHVATVASAGLLPMLSAIVDGVTSFVEFLQRHASFVEDFFIGLAGIIGVVYYRAIIRATLATLAFIAEWLAIPLAIAAVAAAFAFAWDDVSNFLKGNKSVIGELSKKWPEVGEAVRAMVKGAGEAWEWLMATFKSGVAFFGSLGNLFGAVGERIAIVFKNLSKSFNDVFPEWGIVLKALGGLVDWLIGLFEGLLGWVAKIGVALGKLGIGALVGLPKALANVAASANAEAADIRSGDSKTGDRVAADRNRRIAEWVAGRTPLPASPAARPGQPAPPAAAVARSAPIAPVPAPAARPGPWGSPSAAAPSNRPHPRTGPTAPPAAAVARSVPPAPVHSVEPSKAHPADTIAAMQKGQNQVQVATQTPLAAITHHIRNESRTITKTVKVEVAKVEIHTQATDPDAIASTIGDKLTDHIRQAINHHDNGVEN